jgi:hypothetical protein
MRVVPGLVLTLAALVGCLPGLGDCGMKPLTALPLAAIGPVGPPTTDGPPATSCASVVEFDGRVYGMTGDAATWTIEIDDLEPVGVASAANEPAWENPTVFAISGVEPTEVIAMQYGPGATIAVLLAGDLPGALCPYLANPDVEPICGDGD